MRGNRTQCRIFKRCLFKCLVVFAAISMLPFALIYLISTDQINRIKNYDFGNETNDQTTHYHQAKALTQGEVESIESRMMLRNWHLTERCAFYGLDQAGNDSLHKANPWEFLINKQHHLVWCNVFKAASTSWMYNFNLLAGYSPHFLKKTPLVPLALARKKYPRPSVKQLNDALNNSVSFLIVRHPFERLLSAYNDKLKFALPHSFHQKLGNMIVRMYRKATKQKKLGTRWPTFPEFVDFLLGESKSGVTMDMHWTPVTNFCTPCQVKFDVIAKFETLDEDQRYLISKAGLTYVIKPEHKNSGKGKNTNEMLMSQFAQLTKSQVKGLYQIFMYDFELFDYSPNEFFKVAQDDDPNAIPIARGLRGVVLKIDKSKVLPMS